MKARGERTTGNARHSCGFVGQRRRLAGSSRFRTALCEDQGATRLTCAANAFCVGEIDTDVARRDDFTTE